MMIDKIQIHQNFTPQSIDEPLPISFELKKKLFLLNTMKISSQAVNQIKFSIEKFIHRMNE